jgi:two-component system phosphate regulon response regulator PhoB
VKSNILVVEDDGDIRQLLSYHLTKEGYDVTVVPSGEEALRAVGASTFDLVLLDLMLPGLDGLSVCQRLRAQPDTAAIPIIMLTAKGEEADIVTGLNAGANDYVTKPFSPKVLSARLRAVLRRPGVATAATSDDDGAEVIQIHNLQIHTGRHEVRVDGQPVDLSATEFRMLHFLARRPGWVFTRQQILDGLHGDKHAITDRAVDVQVVGLRRHLGTAADYLETVRGVGYRFKE